MTAHPALIAHGSLDAGARNRFFGALLLWGAVVAVLSAAGLTRAISPRLIPVPIAGGMLALLLAYRFSPRVHALLRHTDIRHLTWFNGWRILAALAFFAAGARGLLPEVFVQRAAWGDLVAGIL
ncbi:MAG TPA: hypothetical protein VLQ79_03320, partial [Myxococcaceae bacterium]|nr:hypothetical protein [Myxococcaceae bacterium]